MPYLPVSLHNYDHRTRRHMAQCVERDVIIEAIHTKVIYELVDASLALLAIVAAASLSLFPFV